jgi:hypothetical protein
MSNFTSAPKKVPAMSGAEISARANSLQDEANELFSLYGRAADAPRASETDEGYMRRLLDSAKRYSEVCSGIEFSNPAKMRADALPKFWDMVVSKGVETFKRNEGGLRQAVRTDRAGREIIEWYGDEKEAWLPFQNPPMKGRIVFSKGTGKNAPGAVVPVKVLMSNGSVQTAR